VPLKPWRLEDGWAGDFAPVGEWNPIASVKLAHGMVDPQWFPDEYAAWVCRAYHTSQPDLWITGPVVPYGRSKDQQRFVNGGSSYSPPTPAGTPLTLTAEGQANYAGVEFYAGNQLLGRVERPPWQLESIKFARGLHALHAIGVRADGTRSNSRLAFLTVK
jgi:hypothetical protein